jgi:outer membrane biosynthesis protein TonB
VRRFVTLALSFSLVLGLSAAGSLFAQDEVKADAPAPAADAPAADTPKADAPAVEKTADKPASAADAPKADAPATEKKDEAKPAADAPLPSIPPEVEAKLEAARKAVAEAIVAAQDAGLVETSIEPPPILDILITGRATDLRTLKAVTKENPEAGVSPEVFGAWFTGYGKTVEGITADKNVRIIQPSKGLNDWYAARAAFLNKYIEQARQAKPAAEEKKAEEPAPADAEEKKPDAPKDEAKPADEPKTEDAPKAEEAAPAAEEAPKTEDAPKAEETAPAEEPKAEEAPQG